ncbi:hypothetical protein LCGC14_2069390 [marine sediment metagenome]|uniref:Uncharacterized protein n=1 Tax=marine sediment metagenome TaxID=412755 RepID=A0A0F9EIR2_9ZZZZ
MRYTLFHDCPPGGCHIFFVAEQVRLRVLGQDLLTTRSMAEKIQENFEHPELIQIIGDPGYVDSEWHPPVIFPWEEA